MLSEVTGLMYELSSGWLSGGVGPVFSSPHQTASYRASSCTGLLYLLLLSCPNRWLGQPPTPLCAPPPPSPPAPFSKSHTKCMPGFEAQLWYISGLYRQALSGMKGL
jgi:hypothetical protein